MTKWNDLFNEKIDKKYREAVFAKVKPILSEFSVESKSRRWFFLGIIATSFTGIVAVISYFKVGQESSPGGKEIGLLAIDTEILTDSELFEDLAILEDLDDLEGLESLEEDAEV